MATIEFVVRPCEASEGVDAIVPVIDGGDLPTLISRYEERQGFDVVGGYDGIVPAYFNYGPLLHHFLAAGDRSYWGEVGRIAVLGCSCSEVGCWPLYTRVEVSPRTVAWFDFEQPHRSDRDYSAFGPFQFDRSDYEGAVEAAIASLESPET